MSQQVLQHVIASITDASQAAAASARGKLAHAGTPLLENLGAALAAAQHDATPRAARRLIVVVAGDHGCGDPGVSLGAEHPTVIAARAIADGSAALCQVARPTPIVLVDAGAREPTHMPSIAIALGRGPSRDLLREPAQTIVDAVLGLEAGIALSLSLSEPAPLPPPQFDPTAPPSPLVVDPAAHQGLDAIAIGALGLGSEVASAAITGAVLGRAVPLGEVDEGAELAMERGVASHGASGLEILAQFGGSETAVLAGLILGAASLNTPVILDGHATGAAALIAATLAPSVAGYLIGSHRGNFTMPATLAHLGLSSVFEVGLGHGEGTGAAMVLPMLDQLAAILAR